MEIIQYVQKIEQYMRHHVEEWDLKNPVEEEYFEEFTETGTVCWSNLKSNFRFVSEYQFCCIIEKKF